LFRSSRTLWRAKRQGESFVVEQAEAHVPRLAFLGVRACEIAAIALQDKVFLDGPAPDPDYAARRANAFIVAVNCTEAGDTCFCVSMGTGPKVTRGFDLALTELIDAERHDFLVEIGSAAGAAVAQKLPLRPAATADERAAAAGAEHAARTMGRALNTNGLKELLQTHQDHAHWSDVAERCLACANCTAACPTCFCHTTEDVTELNGATAERRQRWDSCFSLDFSHLHGGSARPSVGARYRQWMTHKLAHWVDQYDAFGCVGCGRCITWCPASIDITAEAATLRANVESSIDG
jgi:formate hydrogenlyase subunit 6/NADH:ubiquinone oxidoreductase subunit I